MSILSKNNAILGKGVAWKLVKGVRKGLGTIGDAIQLYFSCCGPDCCENIYRWKDKDDNSDHVSYVFQGSLVTETKAAYDAKVANGDFSY